jgi:hypothetical protein
MTARAAYGALLNDRARRVARAYIDRARVWRAATLYRVPCTCIQRKANRYYMTPVYCAANAFRDSIRLRH